MAGEKARGMMPAKPYSDEELKERHSKTRGLLNWDRMFDTIAADRQRFEQTIKGYTDDWANQKRKFEKRIAELEKIIKDQPDPVDYAALVFVNHTLEAENAELKKIRRINHAKSSLNLRCYHHAYSVAGDGDGGQ